MVGPFRIPPGPGAGARLGAGWGRIVGAELLAFARRLATAVRSAVVGLVAGIFPAACAACGAHVPEGTGSPWGWPLCADCDGSVLAAGEPFCLTCAARGGEPRRCADRAHLVLRAAFVWNEPVRAVVHALKFEGATWLVAPLVARAAATPGWAGASADAAGVAGAAAAGAVAGATSRARHLPDLVVPVPLHAVRRRERGYDQAALVARGLADATSAPEVSLLVRVRATRQQARLGAAARRANLDGAFAVARRGLARGRWVALVDDVVTTGATMEAAARALNAEAPAGLEAWCLAYDPAET